MGWVKDEKFYYYGVHEKPIYWGDFLKRWELGQFAKLSEGLSKMRGQCFGGGLIPQCTLWIKGVK